MAKQEPIRLTQTVRAAGWAAKLGPGDLDKALCGLPLIHDPNLLVGLEKGDDAAVYRLSDELAIVQTVDFFTPVVDDPRTFGRIAAANSLSDVYAMGGRPVTALNIVCFPGKTMDISILHTILEGGLDTLREAGVALVGGHSVEDNEIKYGLSVTGVIHPGRIVTKAGARPGDRLILTKPLGTGIINTAMKAGVAKPETTARVVTTMTALNRTASELMLEAGVHACTDITGFSFLGHAAQMARNSEACLEFQAPAIPLFPEAVEFARKGMVPGGTGRNRDFYRPQVEMSGIPDYLADILFDPQTSGGLLICLPGDKAEALLARLHQAKVSDAAIIGRVLPGPPGKVIVKQG